jgi:signal transduction histidine kinase
VTTWRHALQQIGGRSAISIWSWIITIPLALLVSSTYLPNPSLADILTWTTIVLMIHCLLGGVLWLGSKTVLPTTERRSRPVVALTFFGLVGTARGLLLQVAQDSVGISDSIFTERMATNILGSVIVLSFIAVVVDDYRTDEAIVTRLDSANAALTQLRDREEDALRAADVDVIEEVRRRIESELQSAGTDSARVRDIADSIVRPLSHELTESAPLDSFVRPTEIASRAKLGFSQAFAYLLAPLPWAVVVIVELSVFGPVFARYGPVMALANLILGGSLIFLGCLLIVRSLPLPTSALARLITIVLALGVVGAVGTELTSFVISQVIAPFPVPIAGATAGVVGAGVAVSLWAAVNAGRRARREAMTQAVAEEASVIERLRRLVEDRRLQAARFLHGPIQGELIAASLKGDRPEDVREVITQRFSEYGSIASAGRSEQQVADVIAAWSSVLDISYSADPGIWRSLDSDPERASLFIDALSEGLTNAVRHSSSRKVEVAGREAGRRIVLRVVSTGGSGPHGGDGIGLLQLRARGAEVDLSITALTTVLRVAA